jgi:hypothetical protein
MNKTPFPTQAVAFLASLNGRLGMRPSETSFPLTAAANSDSRSLWATARTRVLYLFTALSVRDAEPRCVPSAAFTPSGPLVYQWQINRSNTPDR